MNILTVVTAVAVLLGSALIGGVFFAFSSFVMKALGRLPPVAGITAMQSINIVVLNPAFLGVFMGTAVLSLALLVVAWQAAAHSSAASFTAGAFSYVVGTVLVTMIGNVPLNQRLAAVVATDPDAIQTWEHYLQRWTFLNHVRTAAAMIAATLYAAGLML